MKKSFKKYFIPNQENDHKPHFLREKSVMGITALAVVLLLASIVGSNIVKSSRFLAAIQSAFLVDLANEDRAQEGAGKLVMNEKLVAAAQLKANDMAEKSYFAHVSPDGTTPWYWFEQADYSYIYAGENLAVNFNRSEDVQEAWMNSPLHRANILNSRYKEIGIATAEGVYKGKNTTFVVQMFGTPVSNPISAPVNTQPASVVSAEIEDVDEPELLASNEINPEVEGDFDVNQNIEKAPEKPEIKTAPEPVKIAQVQSVQVVSETSAEETSQNPENTYTETTNPEYENMAVAGVEDSGEAPEYTNWFERFLVNPGEAVNKAYVILFVIILFSLILKIFIAINNQHPKNIAYGVLLLILVIIFMYINQEMFVQPVIAANI